MQCFLNAFGSDLINVKRYNFCTQNKFIPVRIITMCTFNSKLMKKCLK